MTNENSCIIPIGTPWGLAMRTVFTMCAEEAVSDEDVKLVLGGVIRRMSAEVSDDHDS